MPTCFFIGHRDVSESVRPLLDATVERHITEYGVTEFVVGHYGRFDYMATAAVQRAKKRHPVVSLTLLLPYYPFDHNTEGYDRTYYPEGMETVPKPFAVVRASEHMIKTCDYLIYKPRDCTVELVYSLLMERLFPEMGPACGCVAGDSASFTEHIEKRPLSSEADADEYYWRMGVLTAVFFAFLSDDMHGGNFIPQGAQPVPIDLETLLTPIPLGMELPAFRVTDLEFLNIHSGASPLFLPPSGRGKGSPPRTQWPACLGAGQGEALSVGLFRRLSAHSG